MKRGISDAGLKRIAQKLNARSPRIQVAWGQYPNIETEWVDLAGKSIEEIRDVIGDGTVYNAEGFGDWENMEDEPLETIMEAASLIVELGSPDEYFKVGL
jgi:hypothetical protein